MQGAWNSLMNPYDVSDIPKEEELCDEDKVLTIWPQSTDYSVMPARGESVLHTIAIQRVPATLLHLLVRGVLDK